MIATKKQNTNSIRRLARFVTEETAAQMFHLHRQQIYSVRCWPNVVYVHGEGLSRFVSYADFPPMADTLPPTKEDCYYWHRRWKKTQPPEQRKKAPEFWVQFFRTKFQHAIGIFDLYEWGKLYNSLKTVFSPASFQELRQIFYQRKWALESLCPF